ncbi:hypothetical protein DTO164E3_5966 [Paecilomyces variotii]|nr:hypothetical protein DTO164E3_5966 [Paecilomyces variotii]KAJ9197829.1 hypothetical protein DTO032I3_5786 [Paecilomyces variotii]KAJ9277626.1 hypothetical protein DTO021D3_5460 [Paecilomyces variotii]KAJ9341886.1 hypothetical protein DTO027B6_5536 [Paecilomyces variotii]KAJ9389273.1 hypothetical protein DTO032I4_2298 [Paecilomyces variotii]
MMKSRSHRLHYCTVLDVDDRQVYTAPLNIVLDRIVCDISWGKKIRKSQENNGSSTRARSQIIHVPSIAPCR